MRLVVLSSIAVTVAALAVAAWMPDVVARDRGGDLVFTIELDPAERAALERDAFAVPDGEGWFLDDAVEPALPARVVGVEVPAGTRITGVDVESPEVGELVTIGQGGMLRGKTVANLVFHPVRPDGAGGTTIHPRARVHVRVASADAPGPRETAATPLRDGAVTPDGGPEGHGEFFLLRPGDQPGLNGSTVDYLIITDAEMECEFLRLADWRTRCGYPSVVRRVDWIEARYPQGVDTAERIRLFIRDAYREWGVKWVLLGGDTGVIPSRLAHIRVQPSTEEPLENDVPADLYYAALDGSWDGDGDGVYGEGAFPAAGDSVDLYPEVHLGRAPCETAAEARVFVDKTIAYQHSTDAGYGRALFTTEVTQPFDWDGITPPQETGNSIILAARRQVGDGITVRIMAQWPDTALGTTEPLTFDTFGQAVNDGYGFVSMVNHGDAFKFRVTGRNYVRIGDINNLSNSHCYPIWDYVNCSTSQFDAECINEALVLNPRGGAVACIAPTRLAWPSRGQRYIVSFYRALFQHRVPTLGDAFTESMQSGAAISGRDSQNRWMYLTYSLLGDPMLPVWRGTPTSQAATHPGSFALGDSAFTVSVSASGSPVRNAMVTLVKRTGEFARGRTDASGAVTLPFRPGSLGPAYLTVTHAAHTPYADTIQVVPGRARPFVTTLAVDDDASGASAGDGDRVAEAGERIELAVTLHNNSAAALSGANATLRAVGGHEFTASLVTDGTELPSLVFLGAGRTHPAALPATFRFDDAALRGRPFYTPGAPDDSLGGTLLLPADNVKARWYLWQDAGGVHLRAAMDSIGTHQFTGSLVTGGGITSVSPALLEGGDLWNVVGDSIGFAFSTDSTDYEDGLDIVFADSLGATVVTGNQAYGSIPHAAAATRAFVVNIPAGVADGYEARFSLEVSAASGSWADALRLPVAAPDLALAWQEVDDSTAVGDHDGIPEAGETVVLSPRVLNRGTGGATGVTVTLRAVGGATVSDSTGAIASIAPGGVGTAAGAFVASLSSDSASFELEIQAAGRSFGTVPVVMPPPPAATGVATLTFARSRAGVDLGWTAPADADVAGYLVYRSASPLGALSLLTPAPLGRSAWFHDAGAAPGASAYYRVAAVDSSGTRGPLSEAAEIVTRASQRGGWPVSARGEFWASPVILDLHEDTSGDREVVCASRDFGTYVWNADGTLGDATPNFEWPRYANDEVWVSPAVADLDGNGTLDVVSGSDEGRVFTWQPGGVGLLPAATNGVFAQPGGAIRASPAVADVDGNGQLDIVVGSTNQKLYAWRANGTGLTASNGLFASPGSGIHSSAALADVAGDGRLEIFVGTDNGKVFAFNHNGTALIGGGGTFATGLTSIQGSPSVGDLDGDGTQEVVCGGSNGKVYVWTIDRATPAATLRAGWPQQTPGAILSSPALGDVDGDDSLEVVVTSQEGEVYAWRADGTLLPGWPMSTSFETWGSPILADVDDDHRADVIAGSVDGLIYAWTAAGALVPGWPLRLGDAVYGTPAAGDIDGDGRLDLAIGGYDGMMHVFELNVPVNAGANPWPMFRHDPRRTGWYHTPQPDPAPRPDGAPDAGGDAVALEQNSPNPFNPATQIRFALGADGPVSLVVYDVSGRRVKTLVEGQLDRGAHVVRWNGRDDHGGEVAAGIYFARLTSNGTRIDRKMVLLR